jgi:hypothetical protein
MIVEEGSTFKVELRRVGGSLYLLVDEDMLEYLGIDKDKEGDSVVAVKAEKSKKYGPYLGFGKPK